LADDTSLLALYAVVEAFIVAPTRYKAALNVSTVGAVKLPLLVSVIVPN
jgi:hypothetical protein